MQKGKQKMESQQESMALSGILGKLRWNHVRNYFINGPQNSLQFVCVCVCVLHSVLPTCCMPHKLCKKSIGWDSFVSVPSVRPSTCSCDQWLSAVRQVVPTGPCPMCLKTRLPSTLAAQSQTGDRRAMNKFLRSFYNKLFSLDISLWFSTWQANMTNQRKVRKDCYESRLHGVSSVHREAACILILDIN